MRKKDITILKTIIAVAVVFALAGCQETLEDRCTREAREYTEKKCPAPIGENSTIDSLVFDKDTHTMTYYYTLSGPADDSAAVAKTNARSLLLSQVRNSTTVKPYKDAGYNFRYVYFSAKERGKRLLDATFTEKDYN